VPHGTVRGNQVNAEDSLIARKDAHLHTLNWTGTAFLVAACGQPDGPVVEHPDGAEAVRESLAVMVFGDLVHATDELLIVVRRGGLVFYRSIKN
jgi:hypothetical protein